MIFLYAERGGVLPVRHRHVHLPVLLRPVAVDARAAGSITSEKERDCWVSLISTPLEAGQIVKAKILGSLWSLRGLVPFLAVVWLPALLLRPSYFWGIVFTLLDLGILAAFTATLGVYCSHVPRARFAPSAPRWGSASWSAAATCCAAAR